MSRSGDLSLTTKGVLVVTLPVVALLLAMVVFYQFQRRTREAAAAVERAFQTRIAVRRVLTEMVNAETGIRGYLLTQRESFLEPYQAALRDLPGLREDLRRLAPDDPDQMGRLARTEGRIGEVLPALERSRQEVSRGDQNAALAELEADKASMDALRTEMEGMLSESSRVLGLRQDQARRVEELASAAIFAGGALGLLGGILAALVFTRRISRRVGMLEAEAREVAAGRRIERDYHGDDELARLGRTLKQTSELLNSRAEEVRKAQAELERRVDARTAELQAANEERQAVIQSSPLAIWAVDLKGHVIFWNPAAERIFGWTEAEVIGKPLPVVREQDWPEYRDWLAQFRRAESLTGVERRRRRKDGVEIEVLLWTAPLRGSDGEIRGTIAIDSDISQQKLLEEQFRQSQKLEAVGRLAGGVAHDFNNLLTVIQGYTDMVAVAAEESAPELLEYTKEIDYATSRAAALTAQLLAFSRRQISQPKILDLNEVVTHSMKLLKRVIGEDVEVALHLDPQLGRVKIDPIHLDQVIMNLVVNARDAMGGGGKLTIETSNQRLDKEYAGRHIGVEPGRYCLLAISDTGSGMTPETRARLFEPFFTTKEAGKGTGLGLSIVYGIIKQNRGEIIVYSEQGVGTTFKIYLPRVEADVEENEAEQAALSIHGSEKILLCEDEPQIRELIERMLARQGYEVTTAGSADDALDAARLVPFDLLITDVVMPKKSGFDLARDMQSLRPDAKVLFMSGYTDNQVTRGLELTDSMLFLQKPFTAAALSTTVRRALDGGLTSPGGPPLPS